MRFPMTITHATVQYFSVTALRQALTDGSSYSSKTDKPADKLPFSKKHLFLSGSVAINVGNFYHTITKICVRHCMIARVIIQRSWIDDTKFRGNLFTLWKQFTIMLNFVGKTVILMPAVA